MSESTPQPEPIDADWELIDTDTLSDEELSDIPVYDLPRREPVIVEADWWQILDPPPVFVTPPPSRAAHRATLSQMIASARATLRGFTLGPDDEEADDGF